MPECLECGVELLHKVCYINTLTFDVRTCCSRNLTLVKKSTAYESHMQWISSPALNPDMAYVYVSAETLKVDSFNLCLTDFKVSG